MHPIRHLPALLGLCATLLLPTAAQAQSNTPALPTLAAALDHVLGKLSTGAVGDYRILWGPADGLVEASIARAPRTGSTLSLNEAIQTASQSTTPDLLTAIQNARDDKVETCIQPIAVGRTGGYIDRTVCVSSTTRDQVRSTVLSQPGWTLASSFNNLDQAISPQGYGVLFFYSPNGLTRQVLLLVNATR